VIFLASVDLLLFFKHSQIVLRVGEKQSFLYFANCKSNMRGMSKRLNYCGVISSFAWFLPSLFIFSFPPCWISYRFQNDEVNREKQREEQGKVSWMSGRNGEIKKRTGIHCASIYVCSQNICVTMCGWLFPYLRKQLVGRCTWD
jgi:hypothetical protein